MTPFVHLHVHTQYSLLDGQASIKALVDKAVADGMPGIAVTDHGNMFGIKEFFNYVEKINGKTKGAIKDLKKELEALPDQESPEAAEIKEKIAQTEKKFFKPIFGCEMYVSESSHLEKNDKGRHLIVLAKNQTGYKNLIKLVSKAWVDGYYYHPRTDHAELEAHAEGLIVCSACLGGEIPKLILAGNLEEADRRIKWYKNTFGEDYYIELQRHKASTPRANHEVYPLQCEVNEKLIELARANDVKVICSNDVHFVNEEDAEAHDRLICLSTGKTVTDADRMLYTKQEWMKTTEEMNNLFGDIPESLANTVEILDKVETYSIDHGTIMPNFAIPEEFGTEEEYRSRLTEKDLFDEFTRDENGNV
ncbi:MAG: PHP domain-containing protein, partial [Muribaculaceae bacterium]|nr:PHP domain-containing protein [Muribaculaceae bacterium]